MKRFVLTSAMACVFGFFSPALAQQPSVAPSMPQCGCKIGQCGAMKEGMPAAACGCKMGQCAQASANSAANPHANHLLVKGDQGASSQAYAAANAAMHKAMDITFTGHADLDFLKGMIPHHQGAVDMAKVVLEHGKDEATKKLASDIIAAQEKEIQWMRQRITELEAKR